MRKTFTLTFPNSYIEQLLKLTKTTSAASIIFFINYNNVSIHKQTQHDFLNTHFFV